MENMNLDEDYQSKQNESDNWINDPEWGDFYKAIEMSRAKKITEADKIEIPTETKSEGNNLNDEVVENTHSLVKDDVEAILAASRLKVLNAKMESEKEARDIAQKKRAEQEAVKTKLAKKQKAAQNTQFAKKQNATKFLDLCGFKNYQLVGIDDELECIKVSTTRTYQYLIDRNGKVLISGDSITIGKKGLFYVQDTFAKTCILCHYDRETDELIRIHTFSSELELMKFLENEDPGKTYGFHNFYPDYHFRKPEVSGKTKSKTENQIKFENELKVNPFTDEEKDKLF